MAMGTHWLWRKPFCARTPRLLCTKIPSVLFNGTFCGYGRLKRMVSITEVLVDVLEDRKSCPPVFWWVKKTDLVKQELSKQEAAGK